MSIQPTKGDLDDGIASHHLECTSDGKVAKTAEHAVLDPEEEKKLVWKCDLHVLPAITVLFFLAFMDRTNIGKYRIFKLKKKSPRTAFGAVDRQQKLIVSGNARIQGMTADLNMTGRDYNIALFIFFIPVSDSNF